MELFEKLSEYRSALANIDNAASNHKQVLDSIKTLSEQIAIQELQAMKFISDKDEALKIVSQLEKEIEKEINKTIDEFKKVQERNSEIEVRWYSSDQEQKDLMNAYKEENDLFEQIQKVKSFFTKVDFGIEKPSRQYIFKPQEVQQALSINNQ